MRNEKNKEMINFDSEYNRYLVLFNEYLNQKLNSLSDKSPKILCEAMKYAVADGGKRVRPILCFALADAFNVPISEVKDFALAIEFIHSYSLVHDDLPSMDNDDYRRGKLSTHKKYGEANGILVGDALLNFAFETCLSKKNISNKDVDAIRIIADCAGYNGMIAGQVLDLQNEKAIEFNEEILYKIYENKTAKLLMAPILVSSCLAGGKYFNELKEYAYNLGILFQITDDILDVEGDLSLIGKTPHKDGASDKLTSVKLFGLIGAKERAKNHYENCLNIVRELPNNDFLLTFTERIFKRKK